MAKKESMFNHPSVREAMQRVKRLKDPTRDDYRQAIETAFIGINRDMAMAVPPIRSLREILERKNLKDLKRYARYQTLKNLGGMGKDELVVRLHEAICDAQRLEEEIKCMAAEEWVFFTAALIYGTVDHEAVPKLMIRRLLEGGYIHLFYDKGKIIFVLPDEVKTAYDTLDKDYLGAFKELQSILDEYARAAVNLYGVFSLKEFADLVKHYVFDGKDSFLDEHLYDNYLNGYDGCDGDYVAYKGYLVSKELVHENGQVSTKGVESLLKDRSGKPRYHPSAEVFVKYADPHYYEVTPQVSALQKTLLGFGVNEKTVDRVIKTLHDVIAGEFEHNEMYQVLERYGVVLEFEQLKTILHLVTDMSNHTRIWSNYGHTPEEIYLQMRGGAPRMPVMGGTFRQTAGDVIEAPDKSKKEGRAMGVSNQALANSQPMDAQRLPHEAGNPDVKAPAITQGNIPRNGPCPCGSGKKYKHCCGREA